MVSKKARSPLLRSTLYILLSTLLPISNHFAEEQITEPIKSNLDYISPEKEHTEKPDESLSLDELLKTEVPELTKENSAIKNLWERLVEAISKNQFEDANGYSASLLNAKDILTPMRLEYCLIYNELSKNPDSGPETVSATSLSIAQIDQKSEKLEIENQSLLEERPLIYKKIEDRNKAKATSAIIGSLIGAGLGAGLGAAAGGGNGAAIGAGAGAAAGAAGGYGVAAATTPEVRLQYIEQRLHEISAEKLAVETERRNLLSKLSEEENQKEQAKADARKDLRDRVVRLMEMFMTENEYQPAAALANAYLKLKGMDSVISLKSSEIYREQAKVTVITKVAKTIRRDVEKIFGSKTKGMKPWTALAELHRMAQMAKNKFHDPNQLKVLEKELYETNEIIQAAKSGAERQRNDCLSQGKQDADSALKQLEIYANTYTDDPDYQKAVIELKKLQTEQAERKVAKQMAAVEETIANDPEKAKVLLQGLLSKELPELEKTILDAKVSAAFARIYLHEIQLIRADLDEAQKYLEKYVVETNSDAATVDLGSVHDQLVDFENYQSEQTKDGWGAGLNLPAVGGSVGKNQASASDEGRKLRVSGSGSNNRFFSFAGRLMIGVENINRALSLLEGSCVRAKEIRQDPNLNKILAIRVDGICKSIEVSLDQLKGFRQSEIESRKWTWIFLGSGLGILSLVSLFCFIRLKKKNPLPA